MSFPIMDAVSSAGRYLLSNPKTLFTTLKHATGLRAAVPMDAVRWTIANLISGDNAPKELNIGARAGALTIDALVELYGTQMRAGLNVCALSLDVSSESILVTLQITDLKLTVVGKPNHPLAKMVQSGALDLKKPANLLNFVPKKPAALVSAKGDTFELDLMKIPKIAENIRLRVALEAVTPTLNLAAISTDDADDLLLIGFKATPSGLPETLNALKNLLPIR